jgi:[acyl-carrier-protein] S-malonyltransferase
VGFAVLFPGQGSQFVGMGADLFEARPDLLGDAADEVLGWSLRRLCLEGPEEELTRTDRAQPALFAIAYALWEELAESLGAAPPSAAAGHSLGEYTALAAAGAIDYPAALRLVATRGRAMDAAARLEPSGMAALIGASAEEAEQIAAARRLDGGRLWVANLNAPGQVVVAGASADISWLEQQGQHLGVRRVVPLRVAGAFHSPFMEPAVEMLGSALDDVAFAPASFPVWANVTAAPFAPGEEARLLARQVVSPVRFAETLGGMAAAGVDTFIHVGPGDVTAGMARRTVSGARVIVVSDRPRAAETGSTLTAPVR